ncbi:hypothetical protein E2C01_077526 [Portunus trituberculatus]|uniref:Uncharacterized protein n=1 Tax=Portunus trituberculatus TaxID=210409 RepID=A0A5B7IEP2_PORTR|nr:hypothetical protein [Portunus trituberculatus]
MSVVFKYIEKRIMLLTAPTPKQTAMNKIYMGKYPAGNAQWKPDYRARFAIRNGSKNGSKHKRH